jgi:hypothetical protein
MLLLKILAKQGVIAESEAKVLSDLVGAMTLAKQQAP